MSLNDPVGISLQDASRRLAREATALGDYLAVLDRDQGHTRDQKLATAFPTTGTNTAKSQSRFANQFVAARGKMGLTGLPVDLLLITQSSHSKDELRLTEAGWAFALMKNPILDLDIDKASARFTDEETEFLLSHVANSVPTEDFPYRAILEAVLSGTNTPGGIDSALRDYIPDHESGRLTTGFLASQRSGAISRMTDLGLVRRQRLGVRVIYEATDAGHRYLNHYHN